MSLLWKQNIVQTKTNLNKTKSEMNYSVIIEASVLNSSDAYTVFSVEAGIKDRSELAIKKVKNKIIFTIKASDITALKSCINTVIKSLSIYEKTNQLVNQNGK